MLRNLIAAATGLIPVVLIFDNQLGLSDVPIIASILGVAAGLSRALADPVTQRWLDTWIYPHPYPQNRHPDYGPAFRNGGSQELPPQPGSAAPPGED